VREKDRKIHGKIIKTYAKLDFFFTFNWKYLIRERKKDNLLLLLLLLLWFTAR